MSFDGDICNKSIQKTVYILYHVHFIITQNYGDNYRPSTHPFVSPRRWGGVANPISLKRACTTEEKNTYGKNAYRSNFREWRVVSAFWCIDISHL